MIVKKSDLDILLAYACCTISGLPCTSCPLDKGRAVKCPGVTKRQVTEAVKRMKGET